MRPKTFLRAEESSNEYTPFIPNRLLEREAGRAIAFDLASYLAGLAKDWPRSGFYQIGPLRPLSSARRPRMGRASSALHIIRSRSTTLSGARRIIRNKHDGRFTTVPNAILEDLRLSIEAKGLLCYLLSRPPSWNTRQDHVQRTLRIGRKLLRRCRDELIDAGYLICDANQSRDDLNRFTTLNYVVRDIPISSSPDIPKPQRPAPLRPRSNGNNKDQIKTDLNNTLPKPLSPENEEKGLTQQVLYSEMGRRALEAGGHPVYVGSKPYDAWLKFRGADGMPSFVDRLLVSGRIREVVWMPSVYPPRSFSDKDGEGA